MDALRQAGQPADQRIGQVAQKISQVCDREHRASALLSPKRYVSLRSTRSITKLGKSRFALVNRSTWSSISAHQQGQPYLLKEEFDAVADLFKTTS